MTMHFMFGMLLFLSKSAASSAYLIFNVELDVPQLQENISTVETIVGGQPTTIQAHPYQVSVQNSGSHICGGSIISRTRILTSAHCTEGASASSLSVRVGSSYSDQGGAIHRVASITQHPQYNSLTSDNDIAILKLNSSIVLDSSTQLVNLPNATTPEPAVGTLAVVTGWGNLQTLQEVQVQRVSTDDCGRLSTPIPSNLMCFGDNGTNVCEGDSGGPLVQNGLQIGIVSFGFGCRRPGVYTKVRNYQGFLQNA